MQDLENYLAKKLETADSKEFMFLCFGSLALTCQNAVKKVLSDLEKGK